MDIRYALDNFKSILVKLFPTEQRPDPMIAIMGPTGTGKSSFIRLITGNKDIQIGHGVHSMTSEIGLFRYRGTHGHCITFVDTPGFDDSREGETDTDALKKIASFLYVEFEVGKQLTGIIYLHRITDPRMGGISICNMRMFRKLCGEDALRNVVVVTTRWDDVLEKDREVMGRREKELMETKGKFFEPLIAAGGRFFRHDNTFESASKIIEQVLNNDPVVLQFQVHNGIMLGETAAGVEPAEELKELIAKHSREMGDLQKEMATAIAEKDVILRNQLDAERIKMERELQKQEKAKKQMERDLDSVKEVVSATREEEERRMRLQREEFLEDLRNAEERTEKEHQKLKAAMDQMSESNRHLESQMKQIDAATRHMDYENQRRLEQVQRQVDQARREKAESDRQYQRLLQSR